MTVLGLLLSLSLLAGIWRIVLGPTRADRALGVQLMSTTTIALLVIAADWQSMPALRDVALVLALLAAVVIAALVQRLRGTGHE